MKGCTITMPLEEYHKLEEYIKQIDTMDSYIQQIEALKGEIQSLKDINEELKWSSGDKIALAHNKVMEELWYYSQTGDYIPTKIQEQLEKTDGDGGDPDDIHCIFSELREMFSGREEKYNQFIDGDIWMDYDNLTTEGPDCILGCKNLEEFREKFLSYFRKDSFRKRYKLPLTIKT